MQSSLKKIICIAAAALVFFLPPATALAAETESDPSGSEIMAASTRPEFEGYFDYGAFGSLNLDCISARENNDNPGSYIAVYEGSMTCHYTMRNVTDYTYYTGAAYFNLEITRETPAGDEIAIGQPSVWISDVYTPDDTYKVSFMVLDSSPEGVTLMVCMYFNNYYVTTAASPNVNFTINMRHSVIIPELADITQYNWSADSDVDWVGNIYATSSPASQDIDSIYDAADQQMQQQQQIADEQAAISESIAAAQSQQSAEQHQDIVSGYDSAANNDMLAEKNEVLQDFEDQQHSAISSGQQYVSDFSANYDTSTLMAMTPAFSLISTLFNGLWSGMGQFSTVLIVGLMLCVAGYILKLKH